MWSGLIYFVADLAGTMFMNLSLKTLPSYFFCFFSVNRTVPEIFANIEWSFPIPAFSPGKNFVPRCLTMIEPASTACSPNTLTPRRFAFESRPFLVDPPDFVCDIMWWSNARRILGEIWFGCKRKFTCRGLLRCSIYGIM